LLCAEYSPVAMEKEELSQNLRTADEVVESPHITLFLIIDALAYI